MLFPKSLIRSFRKICRLYNFENLKFVEDMVVSNVARISSEQTAKVKVYDVSDKTNPVLKREVGLDGYYSNSRMIGDYVYFISHKGAYYSTFMNDYDIRRDCHISLQLRTALPASRRCCLQRGAYNHSRA